MENSSKHFVFTLRRVLASCADQKCHHKMWHCVIASNPREIIDVLGNNRGCHGSLCSSEPESVDPCEKRSNVLDPIQVSFTAEEQDRLCTLLSTTDIAEAIERSSSSPGIDGLPASFFRLYPDLFCACLEIVFEYLLRQ